MAELDRGSGPGSRVRPTVFLIPLAESPPQPGDAHLDPAVENQDRACEHAEDDEQHLEKHPIGVWIDIHGQSVVVSC